MLTNKRGRDGSQEMKRWKQRIIIFRWGKESESLEEKRRTENEDDGPAGKRVMKEETLGLGTKR